MQEDVDFDDDLTDVEADDNQLGTEDVDDGNSWQIEWLIAEMKELTGWTNYMG